MYLWSGNKDTLYRIHGTNEPWTIGTNISSGCIRLTNEDVVDLYNRTPIGAKVIVFGTGNGVSPRRLGLVGTVIRLVGTEGAASGPGGFSNPGARER